MATTPTTAPLGSTRPGRASAEVVPVAALPRFPDEHAVTGCIHGGGRSGGAAVRWRVLGAMTAPLGPAERRMLRRQR